MKIERVAANNVKREFLVQTPEGAFELPYALCDPSPGPDDRLRRYYVDDELDREAVSWILHSGRKGSIHIDKILQLHEDHTEMGEAGLHELTLKARELFEASGLGVRQAMRLLDINSTEIYRSMDPEDRHRTYRQVLALIHLLGHEVIFEVRPRKVKRSGSRNPRPAEPHPD
jgi:hypothetical protein